MLKNCRLPPLVIWPAGLYLVVFMILPLVILVVFSFGTRDELGAISLAANLDNYTRFISGPYLNALWRSTMLAGATTIICFVLGYATAMWLVFSVPNQRRYLFVTLLVVPLWTSFLLRIYAWMIILRPTGLLTGLLKSVGIADPPVVLYTPTAVLVGMVYNYLPYMILPLYAALEKLPRQLLEAASDLGAPPRQSFLRVTLPLTRGGIVAGATMVFVPSLGDYITPDLMGGAKSMFIGNLIQNQFLTVRDWAFGSAVSTILIVVVAAAIWTYLKWGEKQSPT